MSRIIYSIKALIVNTICIYESTRKIHIRGIFFLVSIGADYNRCSRIYKITRFSYCVMVVVEVSRGEGDVKCEQGVRGSKFWLFFENVLIE